MEIKKIVVPLQPHSRNNGSLDEWLSQRSAKPCTAVRIRQEPPNSKKALPVKRRSFCRLLIPNYLPPLPILNKTVRWQDHSPKYNLPPQYGFLILPIKEKSTPPFFPEHAKDQQKERGSKDMYYKKDYSVFSTL